MNGNRKTRGRAAWQSPACLMETFEFFSRHRYVTTALCVTSPAAPTGIITELPMGVAGPPRPNGSPSQILPNFRRAGVSTLEDMAVLHAVLAALPRSPVLTCSGTTSGTVPAPARLSPTGSTGLPAGTGPVAARAARGPRWGQQTSAQSVPRRRSLFWETSKICSLLLRMTRIVNPSRRWVWVGSCNHSNTTIGL